MDSKFIGDLKCTFVGATKTGPSGKDYKLCNFTVVDPVFVEFKGALVFADNDGKLPDLKVGNVYRVEHGRYYSAKDNKEKSYFKVL